MHVVNSTRPSVVTWSGLSGNGVRKEAPLVKLIHKHSTHMQVDVTGLACGCVWA
jgi:hypothetical protein